MDRHLRRGLISATAVIAGIGVALAAPMEDGQSAYDSGDYARAQSLWRPLAEEGNARAQNNLGVIYENGQGVRADLNEAVKWYRLAAGQGYAGAQNNLGLIYALGRGVTQDRVLAHMWFSLAASALSGDLAKTVTESRDVVASAMTSQQIAEATELAGKCRASDYRQCERTTPASLTAPAGNPGPGSSIPAYAKTSHEVTAADYPAQSIRLHESGEVTVTYVVGESGSVTDCSVVITSGNPRLDDAACNMVKRRWKYTPAMQDGKPASIQYISKITFPRR